MLYYSNDITANIALDNFIKTQLNKDSIIKNNFVYTDVTEKCIVDAVSYLKDYNDYLYYLLNDLTGVFFNYDISLTTFDTSQDLDLSTLKRFSYVKEGFFSKGNCVTLYFSSDHISNPLDVLYSLNNMLTLSFEYFDVVMDYLLFEDKIVYYMLFRYSLLLEPNLSEIMKIKDLINDSFELTHCKDKDNIFPIMQVKFENEHMSSFPVLKVGDRLLFEGVSLQYPLYPTSDCN
ncbi:MAG: hypothetical protein FWD97_01710 [Defluviitaleaceae bacterium]|nr:hypothetical protein [Defluviitaleaceae bacterium]